MRTAPAHGESTTRRRSSALLSLRVTFSGLLCLAVVVLVGLAALNSETNLLFLLFGISVGVVIFSALAPVVMVRKVEVERIAPAAVVAGRPFTISYLVRSRRRWLRSWSLVIGETPTGRQPVRFPLAFLETLEPGGERRVELAGICPARGRALLRGVRILSRFPFGLFACSVDVGLPDELIVYPAVGRFRRDLWRDRRVAESASAHSTRRQSSEHEEFYGVREYRPGDNLRWIHWRRSARMGQLIVRESTPARTTHLTVLLDPWPAPDGLEEAGRSNGDGRVESLRPGGGWLSRLKVSWRYQKGRTPGYWPEASVERIIGLAATALCEALERGQRVGLIVRAAVPVVIAPSGGRSHRQRLLHELALLKPGAPEGFDELVSRIRWSSGWHGRCLICATRQNRSHSHVLRFLAGRAESAIAITTDSETIEGLFEAPSQLPVERWPPEHRPLVAGRVR